MRVVIQKVSEASVTVDGSVIGQINKGFLLLVGVGHDDQEEDVAYLAKKVAQMRIFEDDVGKLNLSLKEVGGKVLSISQFTLMASTKKGNRPSFTDAAPPQISERLYEQFNEALRGFDIQVETGQFGADMDVRLLNQGPVTVLVDSKNK